MTPDQMRDNSSKKVKQVMELLKMLHLRVEAKQRLTPEGFLENMVFWIDEEKYPQPKGNTPAIPAEAPTGETHA